MATGGDLGAEIPAREMRRWGQGLGFQVLHPCLLASAVWTLS